MNDIINVSRRDFLKTGALAGGGLILGIVLPSCQPLIKSASAAKAPFVPNAFVRIGADDAVTIIVNKSEMGQGVYTSLPMLVAEELEADWTRIRVEPAPVDPAYNHAQWGTMQGTGGSTSITSEWERFRKAGAAAREMLVAAAASVWKVDAAQCRAANGMVLDSSGRRLTYGALVEVAAKLKPPRDVTLKAPEKFELIGKPVHRLDTPEKTDGKAIFGIDVRLPGMLVALVARPPVFGGRVRGYKAGKAMAVPGVKKVVQVQNKVAVLADSFWAAEKGREALEIDWDEGPQAGLATEDLRTRYADLAKKTGLVARKAGEPVNALRRAAIRLDAQYEVPYLAHATMEPLNCVVDLQGDRCEIWTGTQFQTADRNAAARVAGLPHEKVKVHTTFLGGGFGRRANPNSDFVTEAVHVAKAAGQPVKVMWTREDDMRGGYYRPIWLDRIQGGLDNAGRLIAWQHTIVGQSILAGTPFQGMIKAGIDETSVEGAADMPYAVANIQVDLHSPEVGVPVQWWRSVGHSHNAFVVESFMDELAHAAGKDPLTFRKSLLSGQHRHTAVLELASRKAGWGRPLPAGHALGLALHKSFNSFIAQVAEVSLTPRGGVRIHRVVCAVDCGRVVNPDTVAAQLESAVAFGLTAALHGAITLENGRVQQGNFDDYPLMTMDEMPLVETHIIASNAHPTGIGEPGVPPIAPAVANAIFAASGRRIRRLPILTEL